MFEDIQRFFLDSAFFHQTLANFTGNAKLRGALLAIALGIAGGQIPLGPLGPYLYWLNPLIALGAGAIAHGDKNVSVLDQIKALAPEQKAELLQHLQLPPA